LAYFRDDVLVELLAQGGLGGGVHAEVHDSKGSEEAGDAKQFRSHSQAERSSAAHPTSPEFCKAELASEAPLRLAVYGSPESRGSLRQIVTAVKIATNEQCDIIPVELFDLLDPVEGHASPG
jgi:hypothetical protein